MNWDFIKIFKYLLIQRNYSENEKQAIDWGKYFTRQI